MNKMKIAAVLCSAAFMVTSCSTASGDTVAAVGESRITSNDVEFFISDCMAGTGKWTDDVQEAVDTMVKNEQMVQLAKKLGCELTEEEQENLKSRIASVRKQYGGTKEFERMIKEKGISEDFIENLMSVSTFQEKLIEKKEDDLTDEKRKEYFDEHYYRAKHVLIMTSDPDTGDPREGDELAAAKAKADDILQRAKNGEDFDALVSEYSEDPGSAANPKGYIFTDGDMVPEFENCVKSLNPGEIGFCESDFGYHIIKRYALNEDQEYYDHNLFDAESAINRNLIDENLSAWCEESGISTVINDNAVEKLKSNVPSEYAEEETADDDETADAAESDNSESSDDAAKADSDKAAE